MLSHSFKALVFCTVVAWLQVRPCPGYSCLPLVTVVGIGLFKRKRIMRLRAWQTTRCFNSWSIIRQPEFLSHSNISNGPWWQWEWGRISRPQLPLTRLKLHYNIPVEKRHCSQPPQLGNSNMLLTCTVCALSSKSGNRKQKDKCWSFALTSHIGSWQEICLPFYIQLTHRILQIHANCLHCFGSRDLFWDPWSPITCHL